MTRQPDPYELLCNPDKTTLTCPGGIALGYGPGPGLRNAIFWNRIGSLFSCYRPAVAVLSVFDGRDLNRPVALTTKKTWWEPNLVTAHYRAPGLRIEERRTALKAGLRCLLKVKSTASRPREIVLFFHGQVEQWPFFDYRRGRDEPEVACAVEPHLRRIKLTQPHPHDGPGEVNSIQTVTASHQLAAYGFGLNTGDLYALWQDHGALGCLKLRLGQVGGRLSGPAEADQNSDLLFRHRHPLYYFALRLNLEPGEMQLVSIASQYETDDAGGKLAGAYDGTAADEWQEYLRAEVPQLNCDDPTLTRYWYYVWYVLLANRTARGRHITHQFAAPSKYMYWGSWIWDTYFHVLGEMWQQDAGVARDSIRAVLDMQFPNGYLPVCSGSQYRMCFHEDADGYQAPGGGGYASYLPPMLEQYRELKHPFEAECRYFPPLKPLDSGTGNGNGNGTGAEEHQPASPERLIEKQKPSTGVDDYVIIPIDELTRQFRVTRRVYPFQESTSAVLIDLSPATFTDSAALGNLVVLVKEAKLQNKRVILYGADAQLRNLISVISLDKYIEIYSSLPEALKHLYSSSAAVFPDFTLEQVNPSKLEHNEKTQTPLITLAAAEYCRLRGDREFAREVLPALLSYDDWLWRRRTDAQGRFILWHGDESGWDNATRHYPVPAKPFDVQVHCLMHREALVELLDIAAGGGAEHPRRREIKERADQTRRALKTYWDKNDHWYYDYSATGDGQRTGKRKKQIHAGSLFAMLVLDDPHVSEVGEFALNHERVFKTEYPVPTLARCDPDYAPHGWGWNGPAWLQVNYFTIVGLLKHGRYPAAFELWERTKQLIIRDGRPHSFELYDPETGTGMGCPDYSWQAMINHLVVRYFAGVDGTDLRPALPPSIRRLELTNLPGPVEAISLKRNGRRVHINVKYSSQVHPACEQHRPGLGNYPRVIPTGLGETDKITGNGGELIKRNGWWEPAPTAGPSRSWELVITCR
ncbi:STAS domain-containing protein [bacterium]|nr:STAS domain-containing protein [bacterium]